MNLSISSATEADYDGIMEISKDVYAGYDYLPHVLKRWLKEGLDTPGQRHNLVLKNDDTKKVIGYQTYSIQDGGKYAVQQALRVDEKIRGLNIGKKFMIMGEEHLRDNNIQVKVCYRGNTPENAYHSPSMGRVTNERAAFLTELPWNSFCQIVASQIKQEGNSLKTLGLPELAKMLKEKSDFNEKFIINDFVLLDWIPYHVNHIMHIPDTHFNDVFSLVDDKNQPGSLSVMTKPFPMPIGERIALDVYTKDIDVAKRHVNELLRHLLLTMPEKKHDEKKLIIQFFTDCEVMEDMKEYAMNELKMGQLWEYSQDVDGKVPRFRMYEKEVPLSKYTVTDL